MLTSCYYPGQFSTAPARVRVSAALALSALFHLAVLVNLHGARHGDRATSQHHDVLSVRFAPLISEAQAATPEVLLVAQAAAAPAAPAPSAPAPAISTAPPATTVGRPAPASENAPSPFPSGYHLGGELDQRPVPIGAIEPEYPNDWKLTVLNAYRVVVRVFINENGTVDHVFTKNNPNGAFEKSALAAFEKARFSPGILRGAPVKSQMLVEIKFDPNGPAAQNTEVAAAAAERAK